MKTHPAHRVVLAVLTTLMLVTACETGAPSGTPRSSATVPTTSSTTVPPTSTTTSPPTTEPTTAPTGTAVTVTAYYIGITTIGARLFRETHTVTTALDPRTAAVTEVFAQPLDPDYMTGWADLGVTVNSVEKVRDIIVVDLHGLLSVRERPTGMRAKIASAVVDQILWTVKDAFKATNRNAVQFLNDGSHIDQLLGVPVSEPLAFPDADTSLALVWITNIQEGDTVSSPVLVEGVGAAFEAQIVWRVYDESGVVVKHGWTLAEECCRRAPYSFRVKLAPGTYTIVVENNDPSGGEAPGPSQDSKTVTVS